MPDVVALLVAEVRPSALLFAYALIFAMVEIEIEGAHGWAEKLPTWYRVTPWYARIFSRMVGGKPLTGYHAAMIPLAFLSFHLGLAFGQLWTPGLEARLCARFLFWLVVWDALWFVLNPHFGIRRIRPGQVWWFGRIWIGPFPIEYVSGFIGSFGVAALPWLFGSRTAHVLAAHAAFCVLLIAFGVLVILAAPVYQRWYRHMRRPGSDERGRVFDRPSDSV